MTRDHASRSSMNGLESHVGSWAFQSETETQSCRHNSEHDHRHDASKAAALAASQTAWFVELDRTHAGLSCRLLTFLDECKDLKVEWRLNKVLVVNMASKEGPLSVLGIDPTGCVEVPWYIGSYKKQFRAFAHTLGAAIPDAVAYETPKMWRVRTVDHRVHLTELLDASGALKLAFAEFGAALES